MAATLRARLTNDDDRTAPVSQMTMSQIPGSPAAPDGDALCSNGRNILVEPANMGPAVRLRADQRAETARIIFQGVIICILLLLTAAAVAVPYFREPPWRIPLRIVEDTFGPAPGLWRLEPPWLDRRRYESPSNIWFPLTFSQESALGTIQDMGFQLWNWGVKSIWRGTPMEKIFALFITAAIWGPVFFIGGALLQIRPDQLPRFIKKFWLRLLPERMLILEQLMVAHEDYGRKLSRKLVEEIEAAGWELPGACESEAAEKACRGT